MIYARLLLSGRVQGVGCRSLVNSIARDLGVNGTVKNLPDGSVEVVCECEEDIFKEFADRVKKGNFLVRVDAMDIKEKRTIAKPECNSFRIEY